MYARPKSFLYPVVVTRARVRCCFLSPLCLCELTLLLCSITYSEVSVSTQCCAGLDALATYADKYRNDANKAPEAWHALAAVRRNIFFFQNNNNR